MRSTSSFVDSDGVRDYANSVLLAGSPANPTARNVTRVAPINAMDQRWHMVTLTSQPGGGPGYRCRTCPRRATA